MSIKQLEQQIKTDNETIALAHATYLTVFRQFESIKNPIEFAHKQILDRFRIIINNKIISECDNDPDDDENDDDSYPTYDSAHFIDTGITMRKDADHPNDIRDRQWTWIEIQDVITNFTTSYTPLEKLKILIGKDDPIATTTNNNYFEFSTDWFNANQIHLIFKTTSINYTCTKLKSIHTFKVHQAQLEKLNDPNNIQLLFSSLTELKV